MKRMGTSGFTLIEVVMAIVLFSFMTAMIISFTLTNIHQSVNPLTDLIGAGDVQTGMDNITRAYYNLPNPVSHANLLNFKNNLNPGVTGINVDAGRTGFITFPVAGGNETADASAAAPNLKVTLTSSQGQTVSTIFVTR